MRTSLWIALGLLAVTLLGGVLTLTGMKTVSDRYVSASEEMLSMVEHAEWERAGETVRAYQEDWQKRVPTLQMLINHDDTDSVTLSLATLEAAIRARDTAGAMAACAALRENARHLYHRDAFTLANVL